MHRENPQHAGYPGCLSPHTPTLPGALKATSAQDNTNIFTKISTAALPVALPSPVFFFFFPPEEKVH